MDFDIGNILYLVITLVVVIIGLMGRKKKLSGRSPVPGETEAMPRTGFLENLENAFNMRMQDPEVSDFQDYEEDLAGEDLEMEPVETMHQPVEEIVQTRPDNMEEYDKILKRLQEREGLSFFTETDPITKPLEVINLEDESGTDYFKIINEFDAGAAVVYSAIINRIDY